MISQSGESQIFCYYGTGIMHAKQIFGEKSQKNILFVNLYYALPSPCISWIDFRLPEKTIFGGTRHTIA